MLDATAAAVILRAQHLSVLLDDFGGRENEARSHLCNCRGRGVNERLRPWQSF